MKNSAEKKRQKLINKLIFFNVVNRDEQQLHDWSLSKLEKEFKKYKTQNHPHGEFSSIQWI